MAARRVGRKESEGSNLRVKDNLHWANLEILLNHKIGDVTEDFFTQKMDSQNDAVNISFWEPCDREIEHRRN